jgi:hypothetical protein
MSRYFQRVPLTINHDWAPTKALVTKLLALEDNAKVEPYGNADHYLLGGLGTISKHKLSKEWIKLSSPIVNKSIPWLATMLDRMTELKPDDGAISFLTGNGRGHIDWPHLQTALNFIISNTDSTAYTWVKDGNTCETYPSEVNTAWLINTQKLHGIENNGERWSLSIHFNTDYSVVKEWFDKHTNLVFG